MNARSSSTVPTVESAADPQSVDVRLEDSRGRYVNFCRMSGTPEELVIDFVLATENVSNDEPLVSPQRVVLNFITAKRLLQTLHATIQQHEAAFGKLETAVEKRVLGSQT